MRIKQLRTASLLVLLLFYELAILEHQYATHGTSWHYLLHSYIGVGVGLAVAGLISLYRHRPSNPWLWALLFQAISIAPDYIFILMRMPHDQWMDVFMGHISIHTAPQPLLVSLFIFITGGWAWYVSAYTKHFRLGLLLCLITLGVLAGDLLLHIPLPTKLSDYSQKYNL